MPTPTLCWAPALIHIKQLIFLSMELIVKYLMREQQGICMRLAVNSSEHVKCHKIGRWYVFIIQIWCVCVCVCVRVCVCVLRSFASHRPF